ncbi:hypothetical protein BGZ94_009198 [Podila epigama]|nr:hypothetical protein BGZ94_009198 [Podila epigama]
MSRRSARIATSIVPTAAAIVPPVKKTAVSIRSVKRLVSDKENISASDNAVDSDQRGKRAKKVAPAEATLPEVESNDGLTRCLWANNSKYPLLQKYHDEEWCIPGGFDRSNRYLFEMLILEGAQAGLSWSTVLHKREAYRAAYDNFDYKHIAKKYTSPASNERLLQTNIVKNKLKVEASIVNAKLFVELLQEFCPDHTDLEDKQGFWTFLEQYRKTPARIAQRLEAASGGGYVTRSEESDRLSNDLKKRGFKFVGK